MGNSYVAAVDLGTTKVVIAVACRAEDNKLEVVSIQELPSKGIIKGDLRNNEQAFLALSEVKSKIEAELGITISKVFIGISGQHIKCTKSSGYVFVHNSDNTYSEVSSNDVKRLIDDMYNISLPIGQSIITVLPQTYKVDDENDIIEPVGMEGKRLEALFNLIIGDDAAIERIGRCFTRAGMEVSGIVLQPLASANAILSEDEMELGVAVIDIGGGTSDLCIYQDKIARHIAVLPIGGNDVNKDIKSYGILDRHLEKLKTKYGEAIAELAPENSVRINSVSGQSHKDVPVRTLAGIIEARMYDIIDFVEKQIDKSGYKNRLGAGIVITGGSSVLKNVEKLFAARFDCPVRIASPTDILTPESAEKVAFPRYSTLVGILLEAINSGLDFDLEDQIREIEAQMIAMQRIQVVEQPVVVAQNPFKAPQPTTTTTTVAEQPPVRREQPVYKEPVGAVAPPVVENDPRNQRIIEEPMGDEEVDEGDDPIGEPMQEDRPQKKGMFGKLRNMFSKRIFEYDEIPEEEKTDEESY